MSELFSLLKLASLDAIKSFRDRCRGELSTVTLSSPNSDAFRRPPSPKFVCGMTHSFVPHSSFFSSSIMSSIHTPVVPSPILVLFIPFDNLDFVEYQVNPFFRLAPNDLLFSLTGWRSSSNRAGLSRSQLFLCLLLTASRSNGCYTILCFECKRLFSQLRATLINRN